MRIYGSLGSGNCLKVRWTADRLRIPYTWFEIDIDRGESRTSEFLARFPQGQVPAIAFDDGRTLVQSNAIIRYLAKGSALLPTDAYDRAKVDEWLFWEQYSHEPYIAVCRHHMVFRGQPKETREEWRVARGEQALDFLERTLAGRTWLAADRFTVADIALVAYTRMAHEGAFDLAARPHVLSWIGRCESELGLTRAAA